MLESRLLQTELLGLGDLTRVPRLVANAEMLAGLNPSDLGQAVKVDGAASLADLLDRAGSTRLEAARRLKVLFARGILAMPESEELARGSGPQPRPVDCEMTAQIAIVPEAAAMLARAQQKRTRVRRAKTGRGWIVACVCIWLAGAAAAAGYRYQDDIWTAWQSASSWVSGNL